jgi:hypothetical protein
MCAGETLQPHVLNSLLDKIKFNRIVLARYRNGALNAPDFLNGMREQPLHISTG